jgi:soluble lytic murein transglycosylase-like protein
MLQTIQDKITAAANAYGVSPALALAVVRAESAGDPSAVSSAGARGLFQLMPATAAAYGVSDSFDPDQNINGGVRMLADLSRQYNGDLPSILAAYNWGSGNLASGRPLPAETRSYIARVSSFLGLDAGAADGAAADPAGLVPFDSTDPYRAFGDIGLMAQLALGLGAVAAVWLLARALRS